MIMNDGTEVIINNKPSVAPVPPLYLWLEQDSEGIVVLRGRQEGLEHWRILEFTPDGEIRLGFSIHASFVPSLKIKNGSIVIKE